MNTAVPRIYEAIQRAFAGAKHSHLHQMMQRRCLPVPCRVLDVGCGTGQAASLFRDRTRYDYLGIEVSDACVARAKERLPDMSFRLLNMVEQPMDGPPFDMILIDSVFHHLPDEQTSTLLQRVCEKLNPAGLLVIQDMVYPERRRGLALIQCLLIAMDRGKYCRERPGLIDLVRRHCDVVEEVTYRAWTYDFCLLGCSARSRGKGKEASR